MRLTRVKVLNYRSILDSNDVEIDDDITNIVGMTGSGKTSFLKMVSGIDPKTKFPASDLPLQSKTRQGFFENRILAKQIPQLIATFAVEELDRPAMPAEYKEIEEIEMQRNFDGSSILISKGKRLPKINIDEELNVIVSNLNSMRAMFEDCIKQGMDYLVPHHGKIIKSMDEFTKCDFNNIDEVDLTIDELRNVLNTTPTNSYLRNKFNTIISNIYVTKNRLQEKIHNHPYQKVYAMIPKPIYKNSTFTLEDEISIDAFISNPKTSNTFYCIAVVADLCPRALQEIRNTKPAEIQYYLNIKSNDLSDCLNKFWKQETYEFELGIDNGKLTFLVKDKTTGTKTSVLDRSDGFKWWVAFFLEVSTILAQTSGRSIILLDNPATELNDEGKGNVLRFISNAANSNQLQIIYSTHEQALVDPWRTDRIRIAKLTKEGTKIQRMSDISEHGLMDSIRKNIGSPARYSLFEAIPPADDRTKTEIDYLLRCKESQKLEYKSSLRWNVKKNRQDPTLEEVVAKELCCFMNSDGGNLLIGVNDDGEPVGLEKDYSTFKDGDADVFAQHVTNLVNKHLGKVASSYVVIKFVKVHNTEVCWCAVKPSPEPVFFSKNNDKLFFIRSNNTCQPLDAEESHRYILQHWSARR